MYSKTPKDTHTYTVGPIQNHRHLMLFDKIISRAAAYLQQYVVQEALCTNSQAWFRYDKMSCQEQSLVEI